MAIKLVWLALAETVCGNHRLSMRGVGASKTPRKNTVENIVEILNKVVCLQRGIIIETANLSRSSGRNKFLICVLCISSSATPPSSQILDKGYYLQYTRTVLYIHCPTDKVAKEETDRQKGQFRRTGQYIITWWVHGYRKHRKGCQWEWK